MLVAQMPCQTEENLRINDSLTPKAICFSATRDYLLVGKQVVRFAQSTWPQLALAGRQ